MGTYKTYNDLRRLTITQLAELAESIRCEVSSKSDGRWKINKQARAKVARVERMRRRRLMEAIKRT
jgi:hypothetical protein